MRGDDNEGLLEGVEPLGGREAEHSTETLHERLAPSTHTHIQKERERRQRTAYLREDDWIVRGLRDVRYAAVDGRSQPPELQLSRS
jgi:hypothetical protein